MSDTLKLALFGTPIKHSLSPFIHGMFAQQAGLDVDYRLIEIDPEHFPEQLEAFGSSGGAGCNITMPLKRQAWQLSAEASTHVIRAQSANTLVKQPDGSWMAYTTDGHGLLTDLKQRHGRSLHGQRILLLGAGGAAAGVLGHLLDENPHAIVIVNRNIERANALLSRFDNSSACRVVGWDQIGELLAFDLVINATSLGHDGEPPALPRRIFANNALCYDLNYFDAAKPLRQLCAELGVNYVDGLGMLVEQAAKSFQLWTGFEPETDSVVEACETRRPTGLN